MIKAEFQCRLTCARQRRRLPAADFHRVFSREIEIGESDIEALRYKPAPVCDKRWTLRAACVLFSKIERCVKKLQLSYRHVFIDKVTLNRSGVTALQRSPPADDSAQVSIRVSTP
jgi:hypothetical protein